MHALRKIQKLEDDFRVKLSSVYGCDADDLPVELDTLALYNEEPDSRRGILVIFRFDLICFIILCLILVHLFLG